MVIYLVQKFYQCMYCDKMFYCKDYLWNYLQIYDFNKEVFYCFECGKNYNMKLGYWCYLVMYVVSSGDFSCKVCLQIFESIQVLLEYLKVYLCWVVGGVKEKKYFCDYCDWWFYICKDVWWYFVVYIGCKDFLCQYCVQWFGCKDYLMCYVKKSYLQELFKIKIEFVDMLGLFSCSFIVSVKEELSFVLCMVFWDVMGIKVFFGMLFMGMYGVYIFIMFSMGMLYFLVYNILFMGMSYFLEFLFIFFLVQFFLKYQFGFILYLFDKLFKVEVDSFLVEFFGSLFFLFVEFQFVLFQLVVVVVFLDEVLFVKSFVNFFEVFCVVNVDFFYLLGFFLFNLFLCNLFGVIGGLVMGYFQVEVQFLFIIL